MIETKCEHSMNMRQNPQTELNWNQYRTKHVKVTVTFNNKKLFKGSQEAFKIWRLVHAIPENCEIYVK